MTHRTLSIARAVGVIGATAAIVVGATFANLSSGPVTLGPSTITSATADLKIYNGSIFTTTAPGFTVANLIPGTPSAQYPIYFQNAGGVNLDLTAHITVAPTTAGVTGATAALQLAKVKVKVTNNFTSTFIDTDLGALVAGNVVLPGNPLHAGATANSAVLVTEGNYQVQFNIAAVDVTGSQATVSAFTIGFTGTQP